MTVVRAADHFSIPNFHDVPLEMKHLYAPFYSPEATADILSKYRLMKMLGLV